MTRRQQNWLLAAVIVLVPAAILAAYWHYEPALRQDRLLADAEKALAANNLVKAEEALREALREQPDRPQVHLRHAHVLRRLGRTAEAEDALARAVQHGLTREEGRREFGLLQANQDFRAAEAVLQEERKAHPGDLEVLRALAEGYAREGRWRAAEATCTQMLEAQPDSPEILAKRGEVRIQRERFAEAADDFRAVLRQVPTHFQARLLLAQCLLSDARLREAEPELLACRQTRPDRVEPLVGLAICASGREDYDRAQTLLNQALDLDPLNSLALHEQCDLYLLRQRYDLAIPILEQVVQRQDRDKRAHLKLAQAYRYTGNADKARKHELRYQELDQEELQRAERRGTR